LGHKRKNEGPIIIEETKQIIEETKQKIDLMEIN
jgi:hypothetical protein